MTESGWFHFPFLEVDWDRVLLESQGGTFRIAYSMTGTAWYDTTGAIGDTLVTPASATVFNRSIFSIHEPSERMKLRFTSHAATVRIRRILPWIGEFNAQ